RPQKNGGSNLATFDLTLFFDQVHRVVMNRVGYLMADRAGQLLGVLDEVHQRIGDADVAARRGERIGLRLVYQIKLERMVVLRLGRSDYRIGNRRQLIVER